jgi:hypothetical protein
VVEQPLCLIWRKGGISLAEGWNGQNATTKVANPRAKIGKAPATPKSQNPAYFRSSIGK